MRWKVVECSGMFQRIRAKVESCRRSDDVATSSSWGVIDGGVPRSQRQNWAIPTARSRDTVESSAEVVQRRRFRLERTCAGLNNSRLCLCWSSKDCTAVQLVWQRAASLCDEVMPRAADRANRGWILSCFATESLFPGRLSSLVLCSAFQYTMPAQVPLDTNRPQVRF